MNILVLGNGFDLAHGLPTKYQDFLQWIVSEKEFFDDLKKQSAQITHGKTVHLEIPQQKQRERNISERISHQEELWECIHDNFWLEYFLQCEMYQKENWIDFESEISRVIQSVDQDMYGGLSMKYALDDKMDNLSNSFLRKTYYRYTSTARTASTFTGTHAGSITFREIRDRLLKDLNRMIRAFEIYLTDYVERLKIKKASPDIKSVIYQSAGSELRVLSFNYSNTFERCYSWLVRMKLGRSKSDGILEYIHGKANGENNLDSNQMVLGIDEFLPEERKNQSVEFIGFKKYYQRIYKGTGSDYMTWIQEIQKDKDTRHEVYIFGHSLDVTDKDVLRALILQENVRTTIFSVNRDVMGQQIANLVKVIGQEELIRRTGGAEKTIRFVPQRPMTDI